MVAYVQLSYSVVFNSAPQSSLLLGGVVYIKPEDEERTHR